MYVLIVILSFLSRKFDNLSESDGDGRRQRRRREAVLDLIESIWKSGSTLWKPRYVHSLDHVRDWINDSHKDCDFLFDFLLLYFLLTFSPSQSIKPLSEPRYEQHNLLWWSLKELSALMVVERVKYDWRNGSTEKIVWDLKLKDLKWEGRLEARSGLMGKSI